ncbi:Panacea domain-containing protein [Arthrobacter sp. VKM Ac-2550]|uniref:Panacea domain-containing protein n=1 Tax=Crystallibacter permensis TaxID=1938888 RepID=UPI0022270D3C|nr:type II toxin-antitoxin system antitoxin SocA domain-containing protein [Arthrobacter sp. VKM Ac-2550]MCW2131715.1 Protein of unknown function (DUF4065) [Arthrobacter sp. VKM Ac-2550]
MTSAISILAYIRENFDTLGLLQRQKLLYYAQAWHTVWHGTPLFSEPIEAWVNGPVTPKAWRADKTWSSAISASAEDLTDAEKATVNAVVSFYGQLNGSQLSELSHSENPWREAYVEVSPIMRGSVEIRPSDMRTYYSLLAIEKGSRPAKPQLPMADFGEADLDSVIDAELDRWDGLLRILADR